MVKESKVKKSRKEQPAETATQEVDDTMAVDAHPTALTPASATMKSKKPTKTVNGGDEDGKTGENGKSMHTYESRLKAVSPIAHPLAGKKLTKKVLKTVRKGEHVRRVLFNKELSDVLSASVLPSANCV
jgi:H/ACA ribonucleoprotein complex subunit 2